MLGGEGLVSWLPARQETAEPSVLPSVFEEQGVKNLRGILQSRQDENILVSRVLVYQSEYFVINVPYLLPLLPAVLIRNILVYL